MSLQEKLRSNGVSQAEILEVVQRIEKLLKVYIDKPFKIGKTDNPQQRVYEYTNEGHSIFKTVFEHSCLEVIDDMERYLICYFDLKGTTTDDIINVNDGGGGRRTESPTYYIYVNIKTDNNENN